jgi:shikimate kinase
MRTRCGKNRWIFLIGFSGSGKSTVGRELAGRLGCRFVDLDKTIEKSSGQTINRIFEQSGEIAFRRMEIVALRQTLSRGHKGVVALGGGAFEQNAIREMTIAHGVTVFLSCSTRELYRRLKTSEDRPLLKVSTRTGESVRQARLRRIRSLLKKRLANYRRTDLILSTTNKTVAQTANQLHRLLGECV